MKKIKKGGGEMLFNYHTHTTFSDGKKTPEEVVKSAIEQGLNSIGFSDHGYTDFDLTYCMQDTKGYIKEINRLKKEYFGKIDIYLGVEEDAFCLVERKNFDYIIGSCHYVKINGKYFPVDSGKAGFSECLLQVGNDPIKLAHAYYAPFCEYIKKRKPDIVGHFDLITKYDEESRALLGNGEYLAISEKYLESILGTGCLFEVNTGAMAKGYRLSPYPYDNLLYAIMKSGNGIVLSSDSHNLETLTFAFKETIKFLKQFGFNYVYAFKEGNFIRKYI